LKRARCPAVELTVAAGGLGGRRKEKPRYTRDVIEVAGRREKSLKYCKECPARGVQKFRQLRLNTNGEEIGWRKMGGPSWEGQGHDSFMEEGAKNCD